MTIRYRKLLFNRGHLLFQVKKKQVVTRKRGHYNKAIAYFSTNYFFKQTFNEVE